MNHENVTDSLLFLHSYESLELTGREHNAKFFSHVLNNDVVVLLH